MARSKGDIATVESAAGGAATDTKSSSVEVVYRGIFQKTLANRICRGLVVAARKDGRVGTAFARYGDSPERNGVPAKNFAVIASDGDELEKSLAKYEPAIVDVSICVDDVMCKGIESWAWYGIQPINKLVREGGFLLVTSDRSPEELLQFTHLKPYGWTLAVIPSSKREGVFAPEGSASFAGLWVFNDDNTDYRCMAAVARVAPEIVSIEAVEEYVREQTKDEERVKAARDAYDNLQIRQVRPHEGNGHFYEEYTKPGWTEMREGIIVEAMKVGTRNPVYKKWTTRTRRPLIDFDKCIKCTLCWLHCPDECFEVTPDGTYEVVFEACIGCSICEEVCPVEDCIKMVNELEFDDNDSHYEMSKRDPEGYKRLLLSHGMTPAAKGAAATATGAATNGAAVAGRPAAEDAPVPADPTLVNEETEGGAG